MKTWTHTAEFKILAFSAVTANMMELDLFERFAYAPFAK